MPWSVKENYRTCKGYAVVKDSTGEIEGCHETHEKAEAQRRALYASEGDMKTIESVDETVDLDKKSEMEEKGIFGPTSFDELDEMRQDEERREMLHEDFNAFQGMTRNVIIDPEINPASKGMFIKELAGEFVDRMSKIFGIDTKDGVIKETPMKTEGGVKYPASDFAYVPDRNKPSTWKLRLAEGRPGNITVAQLGRAAAAFSSGGFRGNKVEMPPAAVAAAKRRIRAEYRKLNVPAEKIPDSVKSLPSFTVYKGNDGAMLWLAAYSNMYRDNDHPPEIISSVSHKSFVEKVDKGEADLPELWLWHEPAWVIGKATTVAYDEESGFALAAGYFLKEAEPIAHAIENSDILWGVSHGMPSRHIKRSDEDPTIIVEHITTEISPLPWDAAANKLASFITLNKEETMPVSETKRNKLIEDGIPEEALDMLEEQNHGKKELADQLGIESKDETQEQPIEEQPEPAAETVEEPAEEPAKEIAEEKELPFDERQMVFLKELVDGLVDKMSDEIGSIVDEKLEPIREASEERQKEVDELVKETLAATPMASLHDLLGGVTLRRASATESEDTRIDGRTKMARSKPAEAEEKPSSMLEAVIGNITSGSYRRQEE